MASPPAWLDIQNVGIAPDASLSHLDPGEQEAITLAQELHAEPLLMDEWEGRREAERHALTVTGVLGVLERAAQRELLDLPCTLTRLLATNFYAPTDLIRDMLARDADRKSRPPTWRLSSEVEDDEILHLDLEDYHWCLTRGRTKSVRSPRIRATSSGQKFSMNFIDQ